MKYGIFSDSQMIYGLTRSGAPDAEAEIELTNAEFAEYQEAVIVMDRWTTRLAEILKAKKDAQRTHLNRRPGHG